MGNATAEGARNQLGRPDLEPLTVLVREAAQNSWDARLGNTPVIFGIAGWSLDGAQRACLKKQVFRHAPPNIPFESFLEKKPANVLAIYDRGTTGLTGPTRADEVSPSLPQREKNFVAFLRNIGQPRKADFGGGTYGYGKAVFYTASRLRTIIVHTHCRVDGSGESRLMAAALATRYEKYTGRHWWGLRGRGSVVDPVVGPRADELGSALGMPGFARGETGTTILVLDPVLGEAGSEDDPKERTPDQALPFMAASALWNFWPKMLPAEGAEPSMKFKFSWCGRELRLPNPEDHPALHGFVTGMRDLRAAESSADMVPAVSEKTVPIRSLRPKKDLGILSLARFPSVPRGQSSDHLELAIRALAPYEHRCRHVALMRNPELIVRYEPGPENEIYEYAGVFKVDRDAEVDRAFADSEPPTHDDWEPNALEGRTGTYVRVALRRIREAVKDFAVPAAAGVAQVPQMPLGGFSERLGGLIASINGTGAGVDGTGPGVRPPEPAKPRVRPDRGGAAAPVVEVVGSPELFPYRKGRAVKVFFRVRPASGSAVTVVTAVPRIAILDGSSFETESPLGEAAPEVISWNLSSGESIAARAECSIPAAETGLHSVTVSLPGQTMVAVLLDGRAE